jgi:hypothetical protein
VGYSLQNNLQLIWGWSGSTGGRGKGKGSILSEAHVGIVFGETISGPHVHHCITREKGCAQDGVKDCFQFSCARERKRETQTGSEVRGIGMRGKAWTWHGDQSTLCEEWDPRRKSLNITDDHSLFKDRNILLSSCGKVRTDR